MSHFLRICDKKVRLNCKAGDSESLDAQPFTVDFYQVHQFSKNIAQGHVFAGAESQLSHHRRQVFQGRKECHAMDWLTVESVLINRSIVKWFVETSKRIQISHFHFILD